MRLSGNFAKNQRPIFYHPSTRFLTSFSHSTIQTCSACFRIKAEKVKMRGHFDFLRGGEGDLKCRGPLAWRPCSLRPTTNTLNISLTIFRDRVTVIVGGTLILELPQLCSRDHYHAQANIFTRPYQQDVDGRKTRAVEPTNRRYG